MTGVTPIRTALTLGTALLVLAACGPDVPSDTPEPARPSVTAGAPPPPATEVAGAAGCLDCHFVRDWEPSDHFRSTAPATTETVPAAVREGATAVHPPRSSTFAAGATGFTARLAPGTAPARSIDFVVGVRRMRMLVSRLEDGRLQVLPAILDQAGDDWFDYTHLLYGDPSAPGAPPVVGPGEASWWTGPDRSFDARCARCHTSGYRPLTPAADGTGPRSTWRAPGIDCEACHGDGAGHATRFRDPAHASGPDPLVRLDTLDRAPALGVCLRCHLEGEPVRHGFRPGDDVFEFVDPTLLDAAARVDAEGRPRELIYEGLSFLASRCATAGGLRCTDCHDPHGRDHPSMLRPDPERLDALCARCHADLAAAPAEHSRHAAGGPAGRCVACHMPRVVIERGHGSVHDHSLSVPRAGPGERDACAWCHAPTREAPSDAPVLDAATRAAAHARWWPAAAPPGDAARLLAAATDGDPTAAPGLLALAWDPSNPAVVRASAVRLLGRRPPEAAREALSLVGDPVGLVRRAALGALAGVREPGVDEALRRALTDPSLAVRGTAARTALAGWDRVRANPGLLAAILPVLEEETRAVPEDHLRWFRLGAARQIAGDTEGAIEAYERKLLLDPFATHVRDTLERLRADRGAR